MFISVHELELHEILFKEEFQPQVIDFGPDIQQQHPLKTSGRAELLEEHRGGKNIVRDIRFVGGFETRVELRCARCLDPVIEDLRRDFDLLYRPLGADAAKEEVSISEAETEIGFYKGEGMMLEDVLKEQVLLAVPLKVVCSEGCKGFCPHCGKNLNSELCNCEVSHSDPRWAALADIKKNLNLKN